MSEFQDKLAAVRSNPGLMVNVGLNVIESIQTDTATYDVPDASNPFILAMETTAVMASMSMDEAAALLRKQYPSMALTAEELYLHMSDDDYIGRFGTPASTTFELYISKDEVLSKAVAYGDEGVKRLTIPRLTSFTVADYTFTLQYPINLTVLQHGGLQVVYDATDLSPIQTLESNVVPMQEITPAGLPILLLSIEAMQFKINTFYETLSSAALVSRSYTFTEQFYYARVYISSDSGVTWTPIKTTHTDQVYNPSVLTAVLSVSNGTLKVDIPTIYNTTGLVEGELRTDIYTTAGAIDVDLGSYTDVTTVFNDIDDDSTYVQPLNTFSRLQALNPNRVTGGADAVDFDTLRNLVIDNTTGVNDRPITDVQITAKLQEKGYKLVSNIDNITDRQFLATRRLSNPADANVIAGAGCILGQLQTTMEQIATSTHVKNNGNRITILPSMLYLYTAGTVSMLSDAQIAKLTGSSAETIARSTVDNRYLYSPFHYVLDSSDANFDVRPYYFDQPSITRKQFIAENDSTQLQAGVDSYTISRIDAGYRIEIKLTSSDAFKEVDDELVVVQLGYKPVGETSWASINGTLMGTDDDGERVYQFDLYTNFDVDSGNALYTTNLSMFDLVQVDFSLNLTHDLAITVCVNDSITPGYTASSMDLLVQAHLLNAEFMVVNRETLTVVFGYDMTDLWRRNRTILTTNSYQTYDVNVPYLYEDNVYKRDNNGQIELSVGSDGKVAYVIEHKKGDQVYDSNGNPVYRYLKGDTKLDGNGDPILKEARKVQREFTIFMVDGLYYFATEEKSVAYRDSIPLEIYSWINSDIESIRKDLLERCELFVYPMTTIGDTTATVREGMTSAVNIDQSLNITYYMPEKSYNAAGLRPPITKSTKTLVNALLGQTTISTSDIIAKLKTNGGEDISSIQVDGLGGDNNFPILTLQDPAVKLSLRKKLTVLANNELMVEDDININYLKHTAS